MSNSSSSSSGGIGILGLLGVLFVGLKEAYRCNHMVLVVRNTSILGRVGISSRDCVDCIPRGDYCTSGK